MYPPFLDPDNPNLPAPLSKLFTFLYWLNNDPESGHVISIYMRSHWEIPIFLCTAYVITVFGLKHFMKDRKPMKLRTPLIIWNWFLASFSIAGFCFVFVTMSRAIAKKGFHADLCGHDTEATNPWNLLFCLSKIPELIDTLFIVLRKRPLIFLHWYHHILTLLYCWDAWGLRVMSGGWFSEMNLGVHSLMYTYFALCAMGWRFSALIRQSITTLQIVQMVGGMTITILALDWCDDFPERHRANLWAALLMYISYAVLFVHYFIKTYVKTPKMQQQQQKDKIKTN